MTKAQVWIGNAAIAGAKNQLAERVPDKRWVLATMSTKNRGIIEVPRGVPASADRVLTGRLLGR